MPRTAAGPVAARAAGQQANVDASRCSIIVAIHDGFIDDSAAQGDLRVAWHRLLKDFLSAIDRLDVRFGVACRRNDRVAYGPANVADLPAEPTEEALARQGFLRLIGHEPSLAGRGGSLGPFSRNLERKGGPTSNLPGPNAPGVLLGVRQRE